MQRMSVVFKEIRSTRLKDRIEVSRAQVVEIKHQIGGLIAFPLPQRVDLCLAVSSSAIGVNELHDLDLLALMLGHDFRADAFGTCLEPISSQPLEVIDDPAVGNVNRFGI